MKVSFFIITSFLMVLYIQLGVGSLAEATWLDHLTHKDRNVCYFGDGGDAGPFVIRLNVKHHSPSDHTKRKEKTWASYPNYLYGCRKNGV